MRTTRHLAQLVIHDLARFSGMTFANPDRLTREEAQRLQDWAAKQPDVARALRDRGHPEHEAATLFAGVVRHFAFEHPQEAAGTPAPWKEGRMLDLHARIADMTPDEAAARLAWARTRQEYREGCLNPEHPTHADLIAQTTALIERAQGTGQDGPAEVQRGAEEPAKGEEGQGQAGAAVGGPSATAQGRIHDLMCDPAYGDPQHPHHRATVAAVTEAFRTAYPEPGAARPSPAQAREATLRQRDREIREHPAFLDRAHPEHGAKQAEMRAAYEAAYPEPEG